MGEFISYFFRSTYFYLVQFLEHLGSCFWLILTYLVQLGGVLDLG